MIEVFVDPSLQVFQLSEIDDEAVFVCLLAGEGEGDRPVVPVDECAMAVVPMLAVSEGNVAIGFFAGEHGWGELREKK